MSKPSPTGLRAGLIICVLALLSVFPPLATDMYLSAMGHLAEALNASDAATELSLSLFFLGLCVGQFLTGPLIDTIGRKSTLIGGTVIYTATSIGLLMTRDVEVFNSLRFIQAIGACAGMVVGRTIVSDLYEGRKAAQVLTILVMLMTLGPILSPFLGSLLLSAFGWESIFVTLVLVGITALVLVLFVIPETLPASERRPGAIQSSFNEFARLARRPHFLLPALVAASIQAPMFAFITASSGVFQGVFGFSGSAYGVLFGCIASALVIFGQLNSWLLKRYEPARILSVGLPIFVLAAGSLFALSGAETVWLVVAPLWLTLGMVGLLTANAMSIAMQGSPGAAGIRSAGIGVVQFGVAFATSSLVAYAGSDSAGPMGAAILCAALAGCGLWCATCRLPEK